MNQNSHSIVPECWQDAKALIVEATNSGGTVVRTQQSTNCIWMKAKSKQNVLPEKNKIKKNDVQRTNKSRRIHGLEFEKACLLFILVRVS
jgi:hypothetical protein